MQVCVHGLANLKSLASPTSHRVHIAGMDAQIVCTYVRTYLGAVCPYCYNRYYHKRHIMYRQWVKYVLHIRAYNMYVCTYVCTVGRDGT